MLVLHSSDWHLGHTLYNYDRHDEQMVMLQQMIDIVRKYKPDAMLVSGDVFHTAQPSTAVQRMFTEAIIQMRLASPSTEFIITAGNHDSGSRHEIFRTPWQALGVHTIGTINTANPHSHIIKIAEKGYVIAVPYCSERNMPDNFYISLTDMVKKENTSNLPVVLMAHTTVTGADFTGHDDISLMSVGGIDNLDLTQFGNDYAYLALGHIHHPQTLKNGKARYSGTPLAISFNENYTHSVSLVSLNGQQQPQIETIEINNPYPLVTIPTRGYTSFDEAKRLFQQFPDDLPAYIRLSVATDDFLPTTANAEAQAIANDKKCRFCHINLIRTEKNNIREHSLSVSEFKQIAPIDIAKQYAQDRSVDFSEELVEMFSYAQSLVNEEE